MKIPTLLDNNRISGHLWSYQRIHAEKSCITHTHTERQSTKKARKAVWMRIAAHSWRTIKKFLDGARITATMAALKPESADDGRSDGSDWLPTVLADGFLQSLHLFLVFSPDFSYTSPIVKSKNPEKQRKTENEGFNLTWSFGWDFFRVIRDLSQFPEAPIWFWAEPRNPVLCKLNIETKTKGGRER